MIIKIILRVICGTGRKFPGNYDWRPCQVRVIVTSKQIHRTPGHTADGNELAVRHYLKVYNSAMIHPTAQMSMGAE